MIELTNTMIKEVCGGYGYYFSHPGLAGSCVRLELSTSHTCVGQGTYYNAGQGDRFIEEQISYEGVFNIVYAGNGQPVMAYTKDHTCFLGFGASYVPC